MTKGIRDEARNKGIRLTYDRGGKRVKKSANTLLNEIRKHDNKIMRSRAEQTKNMIYMCKAILSNAHVPVPVKMKGGPPPPPPPPPMKGMPIPAKPKAPPPPPGPKKVSMLNELKKSMNKKGLKRKSNQNAKITIA